MTINYSADNGAITGTAGLLPFHPALVCDPLDAFVIWIFASVLYHGKWEKGVKFASKHAKDQVNFAPEISKYYEIKSDDELAEKVTELSLVQDCVIGLNETHSGMAWYVRNCTTTQVQTLPKSAVNYQILELKPFPVTLVETDSTVRLAIPTSALPHFENFGGRDLLVRDWTGQAWKFCFSIRKVGHPRPVFTGDWVRFAQA
ncbi:hypothetical protein Pint_28667 [Pistacia integerrima]|uniref:Uncharacterized protein n=1 Tax=Pistacia integerrima TaxID=434235 RepID=A0ACC0YRE8_9ROSI|nr:hypothetical protein Pint_28667 [Pistacia integerrima]